MSLIDDILKGLPVNPVLREQVNQLNAEKAAVETENAILKDDNRELKAEVAKLKQKVEELSHKDEIDGVEVKLLLTITHLDADYAYADALARDFDGSKPRLEYHLQRLNDSGYLEMVFIDDNGGHYATTQQGREFLVKRDLL